MESIKQRVLEGDEITFSNDVDMLEIRRSGIRGSDDIVLEFNGKCIKSSTFNRVFKEFKHLVSFHEMSEV